MIKLTLNPGSHPTTHTFNKDLVVIGGLNSQEADLQIPGPTVKSCHLKIQEQDDNFILINSANDPFATVNKQAFGKKILNSSDVIKVGETTILFEGQISSTEKNQLKQNLAASLDSLMESKRPSSNEPVNYSWGKDLESINETNGDWIEQEETNFDLLAEELELMEQRDIKFFSSEEAKTEPPSCDVIQTQPFINRVGTSLQSTPEREKPIPGEDSKRSFETNFDSSHLKTQSEKKNKAGTGHPKVSQLKYLLITILAIILLIIVTFGIVYVKLLKKRELQEVRAAEGVADVTMALTYAQINRLHPQTQNWSDPEFLKNNLTSILASDYVSLANIDSHGHFKNSPYILRIYTNSDLSHFLVIALPAPSVLQWLIPKNAVIVDSQAMELRKIQDLRSLNRLLVNPNTLEGTNGKEISAIVKQGVLMPLSSVGEKMLNQGFTPPKTLALIKPGAENLIYNAPRYYQFGENYIKRAINVARAPEEATHELTRLQQDVNAVSKLSNMILYSSQGIETALQAQKALATFVPQAKFLSAYLQFNNSGEIVSSKLLMEHDNVDPVEQQPLKIASHSLHPDWEKLIPEDNEIIAEATEEKLVDHKHINEAHPLFFQLKNLAKMRKTELHRPATDLIHLIQRNTEQFSKTFDKDFNELFTNYLKVDKESRLQIAKQLKDLYQQYSNTPLSDVLPYAQITGLGDVVAEMLEEHKVDDSKVIHEIDQGMEALSKVEDLSKLQEIVHHTAPYLNLGYISSSRILIDYQNRLRSLTAGRLEFLLLSEDSPMTKQDFNDENRLRVKDILESAWIIGPDEYQFFMKKFDSQQDALP